MFPYPYSCLMHIFNINPRRIETNIFCAGQVFFNTLEDGFCNQRKLTATIFLKSSIQSNYSYSAFATLAI